MLEEQAFNNALHDCIRMQLRWCTWGDTPQVLSCASKISRGLTYNAQLQLESAASLDRPLRLTGLGMLSTSQLAKVEGNS